MNNELTEELNELHANNQKLLNKDKKKKNIYIGVISGVSVVLIILIILLSYFHKYVKVKYGSDGKKYDDISGNSTKIWWFCFVLLVIGGGIGVAVSAIKLDKVTRRINNGKYCIQKNRKYDTFGCNYTGDIGHTKV